MRKQVYIVVVVNMLLIAAVLQGSEDRSERLVVHEWGTFTVLQDYAGNPVDGVNINEESLPDFVHKLASDLAPDSHELAPLIGVGYFGQQARARRSKGIRRYYHAARMRMETPIVYLYPPKDQPAQPIDVHVDFKGGWITEWYPNAKVDAPGYTDFNAKLMNNLKPSTTGSIAWQGLKGGADSKIPKTDFPVWLAPRQTAASTIRTPGGETEKYLFYRGVANLEAPLKVIRNDGVLTIKTNPDSTCPIKNFGGLKLWLVDVGQHGKLQYRTVSLVQTQPEPGEVIASTAASFEEAPGEGLPVLRKDMLAALVADGLFHDEAEAMLNTWEASYFRTSGLRLFFSLPQSWTDRVLPLQVSGYDDPKVVRAMIGRIELISDRQRELLDQIAKGPVSDRSWYQHWFKENYSVAHQKQIDLGAGRATLEDLGLEAPSDYRAYMELGRFRDALILHELAHPKRSPALQVSGSLIQIRPPLAKGDKVRSFTLRLSGENRIINLAEMEVYDASGKNITDQARLSQSSNFEGKFPVENLVDGNRDSLAHTETEKNPWIKVEFDAPVAIGEVKIWNAMHAGGRFADRFEGAEVTFHDGGLNEVSVEVRLSGSPNLGLFVRNYRLPTR